jgi:protein-tyrosine phosphatase
MDHTKINIAFDPLQQRMQGHTRHKGMYFDVPFISHIVDNLYMGGCENGLELPSNIKNIVSLYPWERYTIKHEMESQLYFKAYDDDIQLIVEQLEELSNWIIGRLKQGPTLVHCQAGLNRSGLLSAIVLCKTGMSPQDAIALLREKRSKAVLCNQSFEDWLIATYSAKV